MMLMLSLAAHSICFPCVFMWLAQGYASYVRAIAARLAVLSQSALDPAAAHACSLEVSRNRVPSSQKKAQPAHAQCEVRLCCTFCTGPAPQR